MSGRARVIGTRLVVAALFLAGAMKLAAVPSPCDSHCVWVIAAAALEFLLGFGLIARATREKAGWTLVGALLGGIIVSLQRVMAGGGARGCKCLGELSVSNEWALVALGSGLVVATLIATDARGTKA